MSWLVEITARYEDAEAVASAMEILAGEKGVGATSDGTTVTIRSDYGARARHTAVGAAVNTLHEAFDPVADDGYYRAWPIEMNVRVTWQDVSL